jgi:hypothetical protein
MPQPDSSYYETRISQLEQDLRNQNFKFYTIATCLAELAIENYAVWKLVHTTVGIYRRPDLALHEAREDFKDIESEIKKLLDQPATLANRLEDLKQHLTTLVEAL